MKFNTEFVPAENLGVKNAKWDKADGYKVSLTMNILISNDDGYSSQGIAILARVAAEFANVRIVAPERDRSGVSNSLTLDRPLQMKQAANGFYYVDGTPTDCIHVGCHVLSDFKPDLVLSGINNGANMGDDTLYSTQIGRASCRERV